MKAPLINCFVVIILEQTGLIMLLVFRGKTEVRGMDLQKVSETRSLFLRRNEACPVQASTRAGYVTEHMLICMERTVKCPTSANSASVPAKKGKKNSYEWEIKD